MIEKRTAVVGGLLTLGIALSCPGGPPEFGQTEESIQIDQLRREVEELKQNVAALQTKLSELEYQGMPRTLRLSSDGQRLESAPGCYLRFPLEMERGSAMPPRSAAVR
ncbi:MAG: hypothetical protein L0211_10715 [Planctomycetaceae bacterium]|nr:hypothetical protein [Planctomycetaceae bacterium]